MKWIVIIVCIIVYFAISTPLIVFSLLYSAWILDLKPFTLLWDDIFEGKFAQFWSDYVDF